MERIVVRQLSEYFAAKSLLTKFQSGFRRHHSTESSLLRVLSNILPATDKGEVSLLALLDVSATFDTVDHSILLVRLSISYGLSGSAFDWMQSFIDGRTYFSSFVCRSILYAKHLYPAPISLCLCYPFTVLLSTVSVQSVPSHILSTCLLHGSRGKQRLSLFYIAANQKPGILSKTLAQVNFE